MAFTQTFEVGSSKASYVQVTSLGSAVALPKATIGRRALIQAEDQDIRWRADSGTPTSAIGMLLAAGETIDFIGDLTQLRFIEAVGGATLNATIFR